MSDGKTADAAQLAVAAPATAAPAAAPAKSVEHKLLLQMAAGSGAGAVTKTATAPLERIKIIFQVQVRATCGWCCRQASAGCLPLAPCSAGHNEQRTLSPQGASPARRARPGLLYARVVTGRLATAPVPRCRSGRTLDGRTARGMLVPPVEPAPLGGCYCA